ELAWMRWCCCFFSWRCCWSQQRCTRMSCVSGDRKKVNSIFDAGAASFDSHRSLPSGVPERIRAAVWQSSGGAAHRRVLDLGAGTGRIGKAFVEAGDFYVGIDSSLGMLREFIAQSPMASLLQANGQDLPFPDHTFDLVLLMQVLSGAASWSKLLCEA